MTLSAEAYAIIEARHSDPFHYLGPHFEGDRAIVRAFMPKASRVEAVGENGQSAELEQIHEAGLFVGPLPRQATAYRLRASSTDL